MSSRSIVIIVFLLAVPLAFAADIYKFEPAVTTLTGILMNKEFFGPPGYGEDPKTDSKEHTAILILTHPIRVVADKGDQFNETKDNVHEVQLINVKRISLSPYYQKTVRVTGNLSSAITGHHRTAVLIEIDTIQLQ